jgi:hypothetical protein
MPRQSAVVFDYHTSDWAGRELPRYESRIESQSKEKRRQRREQIMWSILIFLSGASFAAIMLFIANGVYRN